MLKNSSSAPSDVVQVYYDLRTAPLTLDAAVFFAAAVGSLRLEGYQSFDVNIVANHFREHSDRDRAYTRDQKNWRLANIILKLPLLIPGVQNVNLVRGTRLTMADPRYPKDYDPSAPVKPPYNMKYLSQATHAGADVQVYRASGYAREWAKGRLGVGKTVVMTLRRSDFDTARDTPLAMWFELYENLSAGGYRVFVIPDQFDALFAQEYAKYPWPVIHEAAMDLDLRLALNEECFANVAWSGGTTSLLSLTKARFLYFGALNSKSHVANAGYYKKIGMAAGEPWAYFGPGQEADWTEAASVTPAYLIERTDAYLAGL